MTACECHALWRGWSPPPCSSRSGPASGHPSWAAASAITSALVVDLIVNVVSSVLIVNLWEEMVWAGFVQRTASSAYGFVRSALLTAALFVAIHLPLAFYGVDGAADLGHNLAIMVASGVGMRLLVGALDVWGRGSILAVALLHATFNASSDLVDSTTTGSGTPSRSASGSWS